jgi:hypothetical protein
MARSSSAVGEHGAAVAWRSRGEMRFISSANPLHSARPARAWRSEDPGQQAKAPRGWGRCHPDGGIDCKTGEIAGFQAIVPGPAHSHRGLSTSRAEAAEPHPPGSVPGRDRAPRTPLAGVESSQDPCSFCRPSGIAGREVFQAFRQKTDGAVCERILHLSVHRHWLRHTRRWIAIPIALSPHSR